ncbi:MAG: hypothetical protein ACLFQV_09910, partial [Vulcanimicrobiota bacterium]
IANFGWNLNDPDNGEMKITFEKDEVKEGWGCLKYTYNPKKGTSPGFYTKSYPVGGTVDFQFFVKSEKPTRWQISLKRKSDDQIYTSYFISTSKWKRVKLSLSQFRGTKNGEVVGTRKEWRNDFHPYIRFVDVSRKYNSNVLWFDEFEINRF